MRVAIISMHTCPLAMLGGKKSGGMNVYVRELARTLGEMGVAVDVFTRMKSRCQPEISTELADNVRVVHLEAGPFEEVKTSALAQYVPDFATAVAKFASLEDTNYDIIHTHYWLSGLVAQEMNALMPAPAPVVHMFHTLGHLKNTYAVDAKDIVSPNRLTAEQRVVKDIADRIIVATESEKLELLEHYEARPEQIVVSAPGVDQKRFTPKDLKASKISIEVDCGNQLIMFAGRIEKLKGVDTLLRALEELDSRDKSTERCVVIVGGDPWAQSLEPEMNRLQQLTDDLGIKRNVVFVGAQDQLSLPDYYAASDVVVVPSHYESFGLVALEAMAMGKPVIASEVGGLASLVQDGVNGLHVDSSDPVGLAEAIDSVLSDADLASRLSAGALETAATYTWENVGATMTALYEELTS